MLEKCWLKGGYACRENEGMSNSCPFDRSGVGEKVMPAGL